MPQRKYNKEQGKVAKVNPRVILPIAHDRYKEIASDGKQFRHWLDEMIAQYPELFPIEIKSGYTLHDMLPASAKLPNVQFRRNDSYWYNMTSRFGRYEIVGTVVKDAAALPTNLLADEKHVRFNGERGYIATTVGADCVLGASLSLAADEPALTDAYGYFQAEAQHVDPDYSPHTVC